METVENSERFLCRVFHSFHQPGLQDPVAFSVLQPEERLTAIRGPTQRSSHYQGFGPLGRIPFALGSLSPEAMPQPKLRLVALCGIEAYPGADGLLCGQRSY